MRMMLMNRLPLVCVAVGSLLLAAPAQETVTISRARFEELERKEKDVATAKAAATGAPDPAASPSAHRSPAMNTLPPLAKGETVDAMDLGNHYLADAAAADARYRKKVFKVKGEIAGFDKPMLSRNYRVLLRTPGRELRVLCTVTPPERYNAVFTTQGGTQLTGSLRNGARVTFLKVGDAVVLEGTCGGLDGPMIEMSGCSLLTVE